MTTLESAAWAAVGSGWRQLHGSMRAQGISIEAHDFRCTTALDWGASFHPDSVELCLNLDGRGEIEAGGQIIRLGPRQIGLYVRALEPLRAVRHPGQRHTFLTIEASHAWLRRVLTGHEALVGGLLRETLLASPPRSGVAVALPMSLRHEEIAGALCHPPVPMAGRALWFEAKVLELFSDFAFSGGDEFFCDRQKRLARVRVARAREILATNLTDPPPLDGLARAVGISACYLSRTFSQEMGMTIPQYLRRTRIEEAARLLRAGTHNVSEAAFAVGYASLGHFSKSFCELMGVCPTLYPQAGDNARQAAASL